MWYYTFMAASAFLDHIKQYLGQTVVVMIDRPIGSKHPEHGFVYEVNYGFVPDTQAPDGEEIDVYYLGTDEPFTFDEGTCIAIIHRRDDDDDKLVVVPAGIEMSDREIQNAVYFQEQWFDSEIVKA
jgi:inorganic pyrophosphatase